MEYKCAECSSQLTIIDGELVCPTCSKKSSKYKDRTFINPFGQEVTLPLSDDEYLRLRMK